MKTIKIAMMLTACLLLAGCYENDAKEAVEANGFTEVVYLQDTWFGCSRDDSLSKLYKATAPNRKAVEVMACGGWAKGWTIRISKVLS